MTKQFAYPDHRSIELYEDAFKLSKYRCILVSFSDIANSSGTRLGQFVRPLHLRRHIRSLGHPELVLVREFQTKPMAFWWLTFWRDRKSIRLTLVHNVQRAHESILDRMCLRLMALSGCRFMVLESSEGVEKVLGTSRSRDVWVWPMAIEQLPDRPSATAREERVPRVGFIGKQRSEKGSRRSIDVVLDEVRNGQLDIDLVVGSPSEAERNRLANEDVELVDTTEEIVYRQTLQGLDVVVLDYPEASYKHRTSGVLLDALAAGTTVVCPDFPVFAAQVSIPARVGSTYRSSEELVEAIRESIKLCVTSQAALTQYRSYRSTERLAQLVDDSIDASLALRRVKRASI